jgi:hypothetical protein
MGLDISYMAKAKLEMPYRESDDSFYDEADERGLSVAYPNRDFAEVGQDDGLERGGYSGERGGGFRAGSYSGYNRWREQLSMMALGVMPTVVWRNQGEFKDKPFYEIVHFSDCEGVIGPKTSAKLAKDFEDHLDKAREELDEYSFGKYEEWLKAFQTAADDGLVQFH